MDWNEINSSKILQSPEAETLRRRNTCFVGGLRVSADPNDFFELVSLIDFKPFPVGSH